MKVKKIQLINQVKHLFIHIRICIWLNIHLTYSNPNFQSRLEKIEGCRYKTRKIEIHENLVLSSFN